MTDLALQDDLPQMLALEPHQQRIIPWYEGKAERQPIIIEATDHQDLLLFNEIFDEIG